MHKATFIIKFGDGSFLMKGTPRGSVYQATKTRPEARIFKDYSKAESVRADLISLSFGKLKCEIVIK